MNKSKIFLKSSLFAIVACLSVFSCFSCDNDGDGHSAPVIDGVWRNMEGQPFEQIDCTYPRQTICLRGSGFSGVDKLNVNGQEIDLSETKIYNTDNTIIIALPLEVATTTATGSAYLKVENSAGEAVYQPFYVFSEGEQPVISGFSSTVLTPGSSLRISGENLDGASEVYLPLAFDQKVKCEFDPANANTSTSVYVIVPEGVSFAQGRVEIVMNKVYAATGDEYVDKVFSDETNFSN